MARSLLILLIVFGGQPFMASDVREPKAMWVKGNRFPFFVPASAAVDGRGVPNPYLFDESSRELLKVELERRSSGARAAVDEPEACDVRIVSPHEWWSGRARPWEEILAASRASVRGTIVETTAGFYELSPVTLVSIRVEDTLRASVPFPRSGSIHVIYPAADFRIGAARFCRIHDSGFVPRPGDEVLVLAGDSPSDESGAFVTPTELVFSRAGRLIIPETVADRDRLVRDGSLTALVGSIFRQ